MPTNESLTPARYQSPLPVPVKPAEVHVLDRVQAVYRYRYVALAALIVVLAGSTLYAYSQTPIYRTSVRLLIDLEDERSLAVEGVGPTSAVDYYQDPEPYFQTQYRILTGRDLAERVARRLRSTRPDLTADVVMSGVSVEPVRASRLVDVSFVSAFPASAADTINTLAEEYVTQNLDLRRQNMARSLSWLVRGARASETHRRVERAGHGAVPRGSGCAVARGPAEHRHRAAEPAERRSDARANQPRAEGIALQASGFTRTVGVAGLDSRDPAELLHPDDESAVRRARTPEGAAVRAIRREAPGDPDDQRVDRRRESTAPARDGQGRRLDPSRLRLGDARGANAGERTGRAEDDCNRPRSQERRLHGAAARRRKQSRALPDAAASRKRAAGTRQQPRQQRPHRRARRQCRQCPSARTCGAVRSWEGWSACSSRSGLHSGSTTSTTRSGRRTTSRGVWDCRSWA